MSRKKHSAMILLCLWSVCPSVSFAQTLGEDRTQEALARETLRGLAGVAVTIEDIAADAERDGLTENQLQADVEGQLRQAGIRVLTEDERLRTPGTPTLSVRVGTYKSGDVYSLCIELSLLQATVLKRDPHLERLTATWRARGVGSGGARRLHEARRVVAGYIDRFITAYLSVNPRARPATTHLLLPEKGNAIVRNRTIAEEWFPLNGGP